MVALEKDAVGHAELGASNAARWMACPGSVALSRRYKDIETDHAREGTAAHALAEKCLRAGTNAFGYIGVTLHGVEVTEEMTEAVQVYVDAVRARLEPGSRLFIEQSFSLAQFEPPQPMFGTADCVIYYPANGHLVVMDLKFGQGVPVEVGGNSQLRYYALGALLEANREGLAVQTVDITVVQPRSLHADGPVRSETLTADALVGFAAELLQAAHATQAADAPLRVGSWCRFCRAKPACPAQFQHAQEAAQVEFSAIPLTMPPAPETLSLEAMVALLDKFPLIEGWMKSIRAHLQQRLQENQPVPGYKLVEKRAIRRWADEREARVYFLGTGLSLETIEDRSLKSPAQVEKIVGKKALPADLVVKKSSGVTMAPEYDPRPAATFAAGMEFDTVSSSE